jgi:aspartyl/asparaginyl beta-hydroxylase (cupin superfamily)
MRGFLLAQPVNPDVDRFAQAADAAARAGRLDEAGRIFGEVLRLSPQHPRALLFLGQQTLHRGDARGALDLLARAAVAAPKDPLAWLNLSFARRTLADSAGEIDALDKALVADPYCYPALLAKGAFLVRIGRRREAARVYRDALAILPPDDQLPPPLRQAAAKAREIVNENAKALEAFLTSRLAPSHTREPRFDETLGLAAGTRKRYVQDASVLLVPQLPPLSFYDTAQFPWLSQITAQTDAIREELLVLLKEDGAEFAPYVQHPDGVPLNQWAELNRSPRWSAFFLWKDGARVDAHCARCPGTAAAAAVEALPLARMSGYAPTVFFSTLEPHTRIPPHTGATNARLIVHIPLIVPERCSFRVGNDVREWKPGEALVFDDTMEHEAVNDSDKLRVVLIFDIWNPFLTESERTLIQELLLGMREYYSAP